MAAQKSMSTVHCNVAELQTKEDFDTIFKVLRIIAKDIRIVRSRKSGVIYVCKDVICSRGQKDFDRVYNEYRLVQQTGLNKYYGLFYDQHNSSMMIIMELLQMDLLEHLGKQPQGKLPEAEVKVIAMDILQKLQILHEQHYIHCDVKPENIMLRTPNQSSKTVKTPKAAEWNLIDFGSILRVHEHSGVAHAKYRGTPSFSPPEITKCNLQSSTKKYNEYTYAVDIWALGLVILYAVVGTQPYLLSVDEYEQHKHDLFEFYYNHKLMRMPVDSDADDGDDNDSNDEVLDDEKETGFAVFACLGSPKANKKKRVHQCTQSKLRNHGEEYLQNYLIKLFFDNRISQQLFDLLHNFMLPFDPKKRVRAGQLMKHQWFYVD